MSRNTPSEESHLSDHLSVLRRRWRTIVATFVAFVGIAAAVNYRLPPVYEAASRVVIGGGMGAGLLSDRVSPMEGYLLERRSFETQLEVIRSEPVARIAGEKLGWIDENTPEARIPGIVASIKAALTVRHLRDTRIVILLARAGSPEKAREISDAVAAAYIDYARDEGENARTRSISWLTDQLADLREKLRDSEQRLVDYLAEEEIEVEADASGEPSVGSGSDARRTQLAAAEVALSELLGRYRARHPKVVEARANVAGLRQRIAAEQDRRAEAQRRLTQYRLLKRDANLDHEMYEVLLKKLKETDVSEGLGSADIRVLERAKQPTSPVAPRKARNLAVAALLGLCGSLMLALAVEYFDRSITTSEDVSRALGLSTLGLVRSFDFDGENSRLVTDRPGSLEAETFRTLRSNVRFSHVDVPRRVVLVTSTGPAEGKSTILANLGASLAQSGRRTLVIDTDLRRPVLHRIFGVERSSGLADALAGDVELEDTIRSTRVEGLDLIPCGTVPANPAELIESVRLQDLLAGLRERYEYVLLDSPPAGGLVDASLLSALSDGVLFVVEPRRYDWRVLRATLRQLDRAGARIYGVVINKAPLDPAAPLYSYYHYGHDAEEAEDSPDLNPAGAA